MQDQTGISQTNQLVYICDEESDAVFKMSRMNLTHLLGWIFLTCLLCACSVDQASGCHPPPEGFSETDLVGTWHSGLSWRSNTLGIKEDGTYKQIIHIDHYTEDSSFEYESDWLPWLLAYGEKGLIQ